ncbi:MAG: DUF3570 domain-containing protein [Acidiferrobacterales bacterium]|nr:DUF3570 domain-containing protein [Acidiferrobacterales bacterium]
MSTSVAAGGDPWEFDAAVLYYSEVDRVTAAEPLINVRKNFGDDRVLNLRFVIDSLSGATPNGAIAANEVQTFTTPSGAGSYTALPGETPLDPTFQDTRTAFTAQWEQPFGRLTKGSFSANASTEYDFKSLGASAAVARDFNNRNTTFSAGLAAEFDVIEPVGGVPIPLASMAPPGAVQPRQGADEDKTVIDVLLGVSQIISRRALMQLNYSYSDSSGYQMDPYKLISVIAPILGDPVDYVYENRPDSRRKQSLFWKLKYHLTADVVDFSYRFLWDDWGINSHTLDLHYRWQLRRKWYLEPHVRFYTQSAADFYVPDLFSSSPLPTFASADYRLADFDAWTVGLNYGQTLSTKRQYNLRLEYYRQRGDDAFPDLDAIIAQFSYKF